MYRVEISQRCWSWQRATEADHPPPFQQVLCWHKGKPLSVLRGRTQDPGLWHSGHQLCCLADSTRAIPSKCLGTQLWGAGRGLAALALALSVYERDLFDAGSFSLIPFPHLGIIVYTQLPQFRSSGEQGAQSLQVACATLELVFLLRA